MSSVRLIAQARDRLTDDGVLLIEVGGLRAAMEDAFGRLKLRWLPTQDGSNCVCLIEARRLQSMTAAGNCKPCR